MQYFNQHPILLFFGIITVIILAIVGIVWFAAWISRYDPRDDYGKK